MPKLQDLPDVLSKTVPLHRREQPEKKSYAILKSLNELEAML